MRFYFKWKACLDVQKTQRYSTMPKESILYQSKINRYIFYHFFVLKTRLIKKKKKDAAAARAQLTWRRDATKGRGMFSDHTSFAL